MIITLSFAILFIYLLFAVYYDVREYRVPNQLIVFGVITSFVYQFITQGWNGIVCWGLGTLFPFIILFLLYLFHVLGAGDIKLFSVIGGFIGINQVIHIIIQAFIIGAIISLIQLIRFRNLGYRMQYLANYIHTLVQGEKIIPYYNSNVDGRKEVIPFTIAIASSVFIMAFTLKVR